MLAVKNLPANAVDTRDGRLNPGLGQSARAWNDHPLQYSCLEDFMDRGAWLWGCNESDTIEHAYTRTNNENDPFIPLIWAIREALEYGSG